PRFITIPLNSSSSPSVLLIKNDRNSLKWRFISSEIAHVLSKMRRSNPAERQPQRVLLWLRFSFFPECGDGCDGGALLAG
ncbi:hypothetical protein, partial [Aeromonas veronii]|uniref:hypothetical protein n=1 Tax=Aeromonas veronii TaxID=654 RepID=UPI0032EAA096